MRTFIAVKLNKDTQDKINLALKPFKKIASPMRWIKPENIHLTLKFIGEVSKEKLSNILDTLLTIKKETSEDLILILNGFGYFGQREMLKILWIRIVVNNILTHLYHEIETRLEKIGIPRENREYQPHLTVARNKIRFDVKKHQQLIQEREDQIITTQTVSSISLMESKLNPSGAEYSTLEEIYI